MRRLTEAQMTPGRIAYEADVAARPLYPDGTERRRWDEIAEVARESWEREPTPRWSTPAGRAAIKETSDDE